MIYISTSFHQAPFQRTDINELRALNKGTEEEPHLLYLPNLKGLFLLHQTLKTIHILQTGEKYPSGQTGLFSCPLGNRVKSKAQILVHIAAEPYREGRSSIELKGEQICCHGISKMLRLGQPKWKVSQRGYVVGWIWNYFFLSQNC